MGWGTPRIVTNNKNFRDFNAGNVQSANFLKDMANMRKGNTEIKA